MDSSEKSLVARDEDYISQVRFEVINDEIKIDRRTFIPKYYQQEDLSDLITELLKFNSFS